MLWYKAWIETRSRFLISLLGIVALCTFSVYHGNKNAGPDSQLSYYYFVLHSSHATLCIMWVLSVTLLMMGGLVREKAVGAAPFTLSLPISRARLMRVRICVGLIQAATLACAPWCAMFLMAVATGKADSISQAWFHLVLLLGGGLTLFGIATLVPSLVEGEYTAPVVSLGIVAVIALVLGDRSSRGNDPLAFLDGGRCIDRNTWLLVGPIPWANIAISAFIALILIIVSVKVVERREF